MELNMEKFGSMIDNVIAGICFFEYDNVKATMTPFFVNEGMFRMLGYSRAEGMKYLEKVEQSIIPEDLPIYRQGIEDVLKDEGAVEVEFRTLTGSGGLRWLNVRGNLYSETAEKYIIVTVIQDITERKNVEEELNMQAERLHILSEAEDEKIFDYNAKTDVMVIRPSKDYEGISREQIQDRYLERLDDSMIYEEDIPYYRSVFEGLLTSPKHEVIEYRTRRFDGDYTWYQAHLTSLSGTEGYVTRVVGRMISIQERKLEELETLIQTEKDALTGLYNKETSIQLIQSVLNENKNNMLNALMVVDLDNFKDVNDFQGHRQGDKALAQVGKGLGDIFKGGDIVGRIGGDEFVIFIKNVNMISEVEMLAEKVVKNINYTFEGGEKDILLTCSVGVAIYPYHGNSYEELFEKADKAVYTAKANGKCGYRIYNAANTMVHHAISKNTGYSPEQDMEKNRDIEDLVMQVLFENKIMESALKSVIELITQKYHFHRGYVCGNETLPISRTVQFTTSGYETGRETKEHYELKEVVGEILYESFRKGMVIHDYDLTAAEMHDYFHAEGIKSIFYYPITSHGKFQGAIIFENHEDVHLELKESEMEEIRSLMRIMEAHILQIGLMDRLQDFATQIAIFDNMDNFVYVVNPDTYELGFINKKVLMCSPEVKIGDICYQALQSRDTPCEKCILKHLDKKDPHCRFTEELFNYSVRCWTRCSASWLECREENGLALINCVDISEYLIC